MPTPPPRVVGRMSQNNNRGHSPIGAGSGHFIGWKRSSCGRLGGEHRGQEGRRAAWLEPDRARQTLPLPQSSGWWLEVEEENHNNTVNNSIHDTGQECLQLKFWAKAPPTPPHPPLAPYPRPQESLTVLRPWGSACTFRKVLDSSLLLLTIPGHTWVYHGPH